MTALRFTAADLERANDEWRCNCGPGSLAAILGLTLDEVRPHMGDFEQKGYTNPTMMLEALERIGLRFRCRGRASNVPTLDFPRYGLCRVQWEGPWTKPGVPIRARYRWSHWIAAQRGNPPDNIGVFDINARVQGADGGPALDWIGLSDWAGTCVPHILREGVPRADGGWHLTHVVEIDRASLPKRVAAA
jgi:hypothetical protein